MKTIQDFFIKYSSEIDRMDLEILIAHALKKTREFVLTHPETRVARNQELKIARFADRKIKDEPSAYILNRKEFFGLDFKVNRNTLIPRPETEMLVEEALNFIKALKKHSIQTNIFDIGTGSGNIIISLVKSLEPKIINHKLSFWGIDISRRALQIAEQNAKKHRLNKKIKFLRGNLLDPAMKNENAIRNSRLVILANLPYLSEKIYASAPDTVKKYEPRLALHSPEEGLFYYKKLLRSIKKAKSFFSSPRVFCCLEISPEQKPLVKIMAKKIFFSARVSFKKDLAGMWRMAIIEL